MPDKPNVGPTGGSYDNADNALADSGETQPTEATNATGKAMADQQYTADSSHEGESHQADEKDMRGGNAPSS